MTEQPKRKYRAVYVALPDETIEELHRRADANREAGSDVVTISGLIRRMVMAALRTGQEVTA